MILRHKVYGLSLPEVLVSLSLIAISATSVIVASAHALASSSAASRQHTAWRLVSELSAWMNARGHQALGKLPEDLSVMEKAASSDCYSRACTAQEAANFFLVDWYRRLHESVSGARLVICRDSQPWDEQAGRWRWSCSQTASAPAALWFKLGWPQAGKGDPAYPDIAVMQPEIE